VNGANTEVSNYTELIDQDEVFPNITLNPGFTTNLGSFDLTYYPEERGPYNYELPEGTMFSAGLNNQGGLNEPETRWAGIMRALNTTDFQAANYEFIEFWMLNPFMQDGRATDGGELVFNLGNVSEDVLRDSRNSFENGIPTADSVRTDTTQWARVPRTNAITNAFDNDPDNRVLQDVGFDGLDNAGEQFIFNDYLGRINASSLNAAAKDEINSDPSNDDFVYFLDPIYENDPNVTILERYEEFNNPQGNSPVSNNSGFAQSFTNIPDSEDLNRDNSVSDIESYFRYRVPIEPTEFPDLETGEIEIDAEDNPFITDRIIGENNRAWYRFKIPLNEGVPIGEIQDFRSIRFIRMYLRQFEDQTTFRFARLQLVRNQWRQFLQVLPNPNNPNAQDTICAGLDQSQQGLNVNAVSIEENSSKIPFGYVLPLGIEREQSLNTTFANLLQNEQSLAMEVEGITTCADRGIYKILDLDMRLYERLEMFIHAESSMATLDAIPDGELSLFIRLGSDYTRNYYEYEVPLSMSTNDMLPFDSEEYKREVWKDINSIDVPLDAFKNAKIERNELNGSLTDPYFVPFSEVDNDGVTRNGNIYVKGNPNLGEVEGIMIGIRNNSATNEVYDAEVWVNELRVSGINERGGVAALAQVDMQLADFGNA
ncbi:MAG: cell surface protein SprA, partial [Bacteroidota bacterium]